MRGSLIAVTASALIAGAFVFLTEQGISVQRGLPKPDASNISEPTAKGDRLDLHRAGSCPFSQETAGERNNCVLRPTQPALRPFQGPAVVVSLWPVDVKNPLVIATTRTTT
jgi:hypothetical protein